HHRRAVRALHLVGRCRCHQGLRASDRGLPRTARPARRIIAGSPGHRLVSEAAAASSSGLASRWSVARMNRVFASPLSVTTSSPWLVRFSYTPFRASPLISSRNRPEDRILLGPHLPDRESPR